jgi:hypothetical protein|tara:strand:+ start:1812 stop:2318 length:507 start_codon:yes stop_codon:yes gene_type:complete
MKITREALKNIVKETMIEESEYQEFFKRALEKAGKSIPDMSDEEKKKFFNNIEKTWKGKGAKKEQVSELEEAQSPAQKAAFAKMLAKKDGKKEDEKEEVKESIIKEGFATWEMSFSDMTLNGVKLSKKNKYKVKARNTVEAIKKAAKMAGLKGEDWIATQTNYLKKIG